MAQRSAWQLSLASFSNVLNNLQENLNTHLNRFSPFRALFLEVYKVTDKFVSSLIALSDSVEQEILALLVESEEPLVPNYNNLRNSLVGIVEIWRQVSLRSKNELIEPLKIFSDNYRKLCIESVTRLKKQLGTCVNADAEMIRSRESYYICCQKLERHKESQAKLMLKIENGQSGALQKFNKTTRALLQRVSSSQRAYSESVQRANEMANLLKSTTDKQLISLRQNQVSRVEFLKKIADSQIRILQPGKGAEYQTKGMTLFKDSLLKMEKCSANFGLEVFISHEEVMKSKRQKEFEHQNPLLADLFQKVRESEKSSLKLFAAALLELPHGVKLVSVQKPPRQGRLVFPPQWQNFREKIFSLHHYCFYFCHLLASQIVQLPHYYIKLTTPYFMHLHKFLRNIIKFLDGKVETKLSDLGVATVYQLLKIAERVVEKKEGKVKVGGIKALIQDLGSCAQLQSVKAVQKIGKHLLRKVQIKKSQKGGMINFTKGLLSTLTGKKEEEAYSEQAEFNILVQLTQIMSKLALPTEVALPYLKHAVKENEASYQYLKDMLLSKRDREQRQKILLAENTRVKSLKHLIEDSQGLKNMAALRLVSYSGFLQIKDLALRLVCRNLKDVNLNIIYKARLPISNKWKITADPQLCTKFVEFGGDASLVGQFTEVEDIITLDVQRSLQMHYERLPPATLKTFLVFYARQNPDMPYCQGMNYIAGLLLLKSKTPSDAYRIFKSSMSSLFLPVFQNNFAGMRLKLYLLDRLLSIFHPDIYDHLKKEMIAPECYSVGWIITAFSSTYQYTGSSFLVDWFWQRFLMWGWTEFYRLTLWLFQLHRDYLIGASYDKCLQVFGEITRCPALVAESKEVFLKACPGDLQGAFESFAVSQELIAQIVKEYEHQ